MFGIDIGALLLSALTAFIPAGIDIVKGAANRWIGGGAQAEPSNFGERLQLEQLSIDKLKAIAALDNAGAPVSRWVANLRGSIRYIIALKIIAVWEITAITSIWVNVENDILTWVGTMASAVMFFLFGDAVNMTIQGRRRT